MNCSTSIRAFNFLATLILPLVFISSVLAHGGEDHGASKPTTSNVKGAVTHTARAGNLEITLKHLLLEPDTRASARLFVTHYETNEPFSEGKPLIEIKAADGKTYQVAKVDSNSAGSYNFELPPLPEGDYKILTRLSGAAGKSSMVTFENIVVEHSHVYLPTDAGSWARTALIVLAATFLVGSFIAAAWFAVFRFNDSQKEASDIKAEVVSR